MWRTAACAEQGRSHKNHNKPCQDATASYSDENITVIALADGAGSCEHAEIGAKAAVETAITVAVKHFDEILNCNDEFYAKKMILDPVLSVLNEIAVRMSVDVHSLSSTLLLCAVKGDRFLIFHVGDGVVGYVKNNSIHVASLPVNGEYANQTYFCTSEAAFPTSKIMAGPAEGIMSFILMSDGVEATFYDEKNKLLRPEILRIPRWAALFPEEDTVRDLQEALAKYICLNTGDDCSIAVMSRGEYAAEAFASLSEKDLAVLLDFKGADNQTTARRKTVMANFLLEAAKPNGCSLTAAAKIFGCKPNHVSSKTERLLKVGIITYSKSRFHLVK